MIQQEPQGGEMGTITGWGAIDVSDFKFPTRLQFATVPIFQRGKCSQVYSLFGGITSDMLCAGFDQGGVDACQDDSGGPLVVRGQLAGIVSFGAGCALAGYPGIYANVAFLRDFVTSTTGVQ